LNSILKDISSHTNPEQYEKNFTKIIKENTKLLPYYIYILFYAMDNCPGNKFDYSNAAKNCLEGALWDLAGKITNLSLLELLKIPNKENISTFYTVTIAPDEEMINCLNLGLKYTNYIKIKLNKDIEKAKHTLKLLDEKCKEYESNKKHKCVWSLDINSDFVDPSQFEIMLNDVLLNYKERIYMIEQAFPIKFNDIKAHLDGWKKVKEIAEKNNILIFADESASTVESIEPLKDIVSGVNIKLEKCGGIRNGLKCVEKAKELNLKIWIGSMVGSSLLMSMAATLTPLSTYSDLDGFLLVDEESQPGTGGFKWDADNGTIILSQAPGLGVRLKTKDELL
jgi:L-alanine-DL-glutamate epimerase-like enolase superfamily enzyme